MLVKLLSNAVLIAGTAIGGVVYLNHKKSVSEDLEKAAYSMGIDSSETVAKTAKKRPKSASVVSIPKNRRTGQYHYRGRVNSGYIEFLVDTGASAVALTASDARKAGVREADLTYNVPISTAGGRNYAAQVTLDRVAIGGIILRDVKALVVKEGLETSLLGMTWLGQLQEVKATPNALLLRY